MSGESENCLGCWCWKCTRRGALKPGASFGATLSPPWKRPRALTSYDVQHIHSGLFQSFDLLFYDILKCLVVHKSWQLSATILIFEFADLVVYSIITYSGKGGLRYFTTMTPRVFLNTTNTTVHFPRAQRGEEEPAGAMCRSNSTRG